MNALYKLSASIFSSLFVAASAFAETAGQHIDGKQMYFQTPASPIMEKLSNLHDGLLVLITLIVVFVFVLLAYVCIKFSAKNNKNPSKTTHNTTIEVVWTVIPILILVAIAIPSWRLHYEMDVLPQADMTLKVQGHQWFWTYIYPDNGGFSFESRMIPDKEIDPSKGQFRLLSNDNPVVVPVNKVIRVQVTGYDVIHSWAMPAMGVKTDAIPGRLNETWFKATREGVYYGQCSELCGVDHGFMPIELHVVSQEKFDAWVAESKQKFGELNSPATVRIAQAQ